MIKNEVRVWESLGSHKNIVEIVDYSRVNENGSKFVLVLMEICPDGHLLDLLERHNGQISENSIIAIMLQISNAICYMHS